MKTRNSASDYLRIHWPNIYLILKLYLVSVLTFTFFRLILFLSQYWRISDVATSFDILKAFGMGLRFDLVISGYILVLPFLVISFFFITGLKSRITFRVMFWYTFILFSLAFLVAAADIPYFIQFFSRFSVTAFEWLSSPEFVLKMITEEPRYWLIVIPLVIALVIIYRILKRIWDHERFTLRKGNPILRSVISILILGFIFIGIRGRMEMKSPIRVGTAYFSNNAFLNQLGLNPNFTLIRSYLDSRKEQNKPLRFEDDKTALGLVRKSLNILTPDASYPLARNVTYGSDKPLNYNVVLVIMESMSADKMCRHGNPRSLTPFLDSLSYKSLYFDKIYTAGIHTFNGIFSTLFSYPALLRQHPMKESSMLRYNGLPNTLKKAGYSTMYFTTHDGQFDNVEGFLLNNDVEKVISKSDYPQDKVKTTLGVPDDFMFEFSIPVINSVAASGKPFMAAFMTASDHGPYYLPDYFKPKYSDIKDQIVEYADWSLKKFITLCSRQPWFRNTIFVFIADHGAPTDGTYEMPLSYYHTPLIYFCPSLIKDATTFSCIGGQIDVFPTLMGILKQPYLNNSLGIDLRKESRPGIFINGDDKYGVLNQEWFLIIHKDQSTGLYKYRDHDTHNYTSEYPGITAEMKRYAESNLQAAQFCILHGKQNCPR